MPQEWDDGFGLYGAISVIYRNGDFIGILFRTSTLPDKIESHDTINQGVFKFVVGTHPMASGYKALNIYTLDGSRTLPTAIDNTAGIGVSDINAHRGSEGCQTIPWEVDNPNYDYERYIGLFNTNEKGKYTVQHLVKLPNV